MYESQSLWEMCRRLIGKKKFSFALFTSVWIFTGQSEQVFPLGTTKVRANVEGNLSNCCFLLCSWPACFELTCLEVNSKDKDNKLANVGQKIRSSDRWPEGKHTHAHTHTQDAPTCLRCGLVIKQAASG